MKNELAWVPNLFQLSTGEIQLLNLFLSIVRDYDLSEGQFNNLDDIKGIAEYVNENETRIGLN
jgi:hypothetical protein